MIKEVKKERNRSFEMLRIIAMIMIIFSHSSVHGNYIQTNIPFYNQFFLQLIVLGNLGVNIFMIISGYYMVESKFSIKKVIKLLFQVLFYSIGFYILLVSTNVIPFSYQELIKAFLPTIFGEYWFFTAYIILYILSPYINSFLKNLSQKQYKNFLLVFLVIWNFISLFVPNYLSTSPLIDIFVFYSIGAYLKIHKNTILKRKRIGKLFVYGGVFLLILLTFICTFFRNDYSFVNLFINRFYFRSSPVMVLIATGLFVLFLNKKMNCNSFINEVACLTFLYI